ncbi:AAA family ATPase [Caulobacter sp. SL161]|uniref:AAA family ATPase n=1 Tax=Caulobacter sp. SL161 TaxID=2995156 RepID=UPI0022750D4F|nr:AAA family ATPase [Caulobacter sp. SL161]MCY1646655.1 AAA family ATPase [Caulobacter sp. SL161]
MTLPSIDFDAIRLHRGTKADAFEELCCQLAGDEPLVGERTSFVRKGRGGDGGVECFATLADGSEVGWQVKYYSDPAAAISSLDESLTRALEKHPEMTRFIACVPFDFADSRRTDVTTALQRWTTWRDERVEQARVAGRTITIDHWGAHELSERLSSSSPKAAGRLAYWFDQTLLTHDWFKSVFDRTRTSLGRRYSPEVSIDLPIRTSILATTLDPEFFRELESLGDGIANRLSKAFGHTPEVGEACGALIKALALAAGARGTPAPLEELRTQSEKAYSAARTWHQAVWSQLPDGQPTAQAKVASNLLAVLQDVSQELNAEHWDHLETRALLVTGVAGSGKSHLLADACDFQIERDRPALMILGGALPDAEPWGAILQTLDLPKHLQAKQFLGALNAAGQAAGVRTLITIDALNERHGQSIWPERLAGLLHDAAQFEWICVVLSCRSSYEELVIPADLDDTQLPRLEHTGFTVDEARQYLARRGVSLAEEPNRLQEFESPLFLRICCDALKLDGQALLSSGLGGVTAVFKLYTDAVARRVNEQLGAAPKRNLPQAAIQKLAQEMAETGYGFMPFSRAYALISEVVTPGISVQQDLLFQLENEGLLSSEPGFDVDQEEVVRFTFERMGDHAAAAYLLAKSVPSGGDVALLFAAGTPARLALEASRSFILNGLCQALSVQIPERFGVELLDAPDVPDLVFLRRAFTESLLNRAPATISPRTWELIEEIGGATLRFETLIALSTDPQLAYAERLDEELRLLAMPQRDAVWSIHIARSARARHLVDWVRSADQKAVDPGRAALTALQLCWFLTTSSRVIRDTATKALVAVLADRAQLAISLWGRFKALDDGYVVERLAAAIYGAAMQGRWTGAELCAVTVAVHADLFITPDVTPNALLRDHGRRLVQFANVRGVLPPDFDPETAEPPYSSPWPIEYVTKSTMKGYTRTHESGHVGRDQITASTIDGDFARYVLDGAIDDWSQVRRDVFPVPSAKQVAEAWLADFKSTATPAMLAAHEDLTIAFAKAADLANYVEKRDATKAAKAAFCDAIGEEAFERWSAEADHWRSEGMYQRAPMWRDGGPAEFSLAWGRRWVCKRAHDLGWSDALHGAFDAAVPNDRATHHVERIGKKYQWLALYELCARMADNLRPLPDRDNPEDIEGLRNIDPSLLVQATADDGWRRFDAPSFWVTPAPVFEPISVDGALAWLHAEKDFFDGIENIEVTNPQDQQRWLVLKGFETWRDGDNVLDREAWRRVGCLVVNKADLTRAVKKMATLHFQGGGDMPDARSRGYRGYLGEHPWAIRVDDEQAAMKTGDWPDPDEEAEWFTEWWPRGSARPLRRFPVRATVADYLAERSGYDGSIEQNINLHLPAGWLMDALGLRLTDGATIKYVDGDGAVKFWDPSVSLAGRSAALVDRASFLAYLEREGLVAIWAISGEKNVYGASYSDGFGGRKTYTRLYHSKGDQIVALERFESFDAPSAKQLATLRNGGVAEPDEGEDAEVEED